MLNAKTVGNKIAEARKQADISQAQLGQRLFISAQAVGKWERGESLPDIVTLNRLAELLGVDLNYFSERFPTTASEIQPLTPVEQQEEVPVTAVAMADSKKKKPGWNMSHGNWVDADFSGLHNLSEKFSGSNLQRCKFIGADLSGLALSNNNVERCDFANAIIQHSRIQRTNLDGNNFRHSSLQDTEISYSNIGGCDFSGADFSGATLRGNNFERNTLEQAIWNGTSFIGSSFDKVEFTGTFQDCSFDSCGFYRVTFQNVTLYNTFFKNNRLKRARFIDCKVDRITYEFLKLGKADLSGITLLPTAE